MSLLTGAPSRTAKSEPMFIEYLKRMSKEPFFWLGVIFALLALFMK
jgi:hypothetical protein